MTDAKCASPNHHTYSSELSAWGIKKEIKDLKSHLKKCVENIDKGNALWNHFSVKARAVPLKVGPNVEGQLALMNRQIEALREETRDPRPFQKYLAEALRTTPHIGISGWGNHWTLCGTLAHQAFRALIGGLT